MIILHGQAHSFSKDCLLLLMSKLEIKINLLLVKADYVCITKQKMVKLRSISGLYVYVFMVILFLERGGDQERSSREVKLIKTISFVTSPSSFR